MTTPDAADPARVDPQITEAVTDSDVKVLAEAPAMALGGLFQAFSHSSGIMFENASSMQQQQAVLAEAVTSVGVALLYRASGLEPPVGETVAQPVKGTT